MTKTDWCSTPKKPTGFSLKFNAQIFQLDSSKSLFGSLEYTKVGFDLPLGVGLRAPDQWDVRIP